MHVCRDMRDIYSRIMLPSWLKDHMVVIAVVVCISVRIIYLSRRKLNYIHAAVYICTGKYTKDFIGYIYVRS